MKTLYADLLRHLDEQIIAAERTKRKSKNMPNDEIDVLPFHPQPDLNHTLLTWRWMKKQLRNAHHFILPENGILVGESRDDNDEFLMPKIVGAHLPYEYCWLEWPHNYWKETEGVGTMFLPRLGVMCWEATVQEIIDSVMEMNADYPIYLTILKKVEEVLERDGYSGSRAILETPMGLVPMKRGANGEVYSTGDEEAHDFYFAAVTSPCAKMIIDLDDPLIEVDYNDPHIRNSIYSQCVTQAVNMKIPDEDKPEFIKFLYQKNLTQTLSVKAELIPLGMHTYGYLKTQVDQDPVNFNYLTLRNVLGFANEEWFSTDLAEVYNHDEGSPEHAAASKVISQELDTILRDTEKMHIMAQKADKKAEEYNRKWGQPILENGMALCMAQTAKSVLGMLTQQNIVNEQVSVLQFLNMLQCRNITVEKVYSQSKLKKLPPKVRMLQSQACRLTLRGEEKQKRYVYDHEADGPKRSVKTHWRRGHIRHYQNGHTVYIAHTIVNPMRNVDPAKQTYDVA